MKPAKFLKRIAASLFPMLAAKRVIPTSGPEMVFRADPKRSLLREEARSAEVKMLLNQYNQRVVKARKGGRR